MEPIGFFIKAVEKKALEKNYRIKALTYVMQKDQ
jgi:hypothetical protein